MKLIQTAIAAGALVLSTHTSLADDAHHPDEPAAAAPAVAAPQQTMPGGTTPGMMSPDMMKMMMGMMGSGSGPAMERPGTMGPMMSPEHIEGRLAFLKVEIEVTETQRPLWGALADALRNTATSAGSAMPGMQGGMMAGDGTSAENPVQRIEIEENALTARLEALKELKAALEPFYTALDETQKQKANRLLSPAPTGLM